MWSSAEAVNQEYAVSVRVAGGEQKGEVMRVADTSALGELNFMLNG